MLLFLLNSILQDLQQSYGDMVSNLIYETLVNVMNGLVLDKLSMQLQYIQSLLENFILGESVLLNSLPQCMCRQCVLDSFQNNNKSICTHVLVYSEW